MQNGQSDVSIFFTKVKAIPSWLRRACRQSGHSSQILANDLSRELMSTLLIGQPFPNRERLAQARPDTMVPSVGGIEDQRFDFHDVELAVLADHIRITLHVDNLANELEQRRFA